MRCKLEENSRLFDVLHALRKGYETGDFDELFPYLAADCVMESQWVLTPNTGYDAVVDYFTGKGKTLAKNESFPDCSIVELIGCMNPIESDGVEINGQDPKPEKLGCCIHRENYAYLWNRLWMEKHTELLLMFN